MKRRIRDYLLYVIQEVAMAVFILLLMAIPYYALYIYVWGCPPGWGKP